MRLGLPGGLTAIEPDAGSEVILQRGETLYAVRASTMFEEARPTDPGRSHVAARSISVPVRARPARSRRRSGLNDSIGTFGVRSTPHDLCCYSATIQSSSICQGG